MKNLLVSLIVSLTAVGLCSAQPDFPQGQFVGFYQRLQGFDFRDLGVQDANFNGGGLGFTFNLNHWFGVWSQTGFFTGTEVDGIQMRLINELQGVQLTKREVGPLNVYAKGGVGFARYVFELPGFEVVRFGFSASYGGGLEIRVSDAMGIILEAQRLSMSLPDVTGFQDRDGWDSNTVITTGVAFNF